MFVGVAVSAIRVELLAAVKAEVERRAEEIKDDLVKDNKVGLALVVSVTDAISVRSKVEPVKEADGLKVTMVGPVVLVLEPVLVASGQLVRSQGSTEQQPVKPLDLQM